MPKTDDHRRNKAFLNKRKLNATKLFSLTIILDKKENKRIANNFCARY